MTGPKLTEEVPKEQMRLADWSGYTDSAEKVKYLLPGTNRIFAPSCAIVIRIRRN